MTLLGHIDQPRENELIEGTNFEKVIIPSSREFIKNGHKFPVEQNAFINFNINYIGIKGKDYSSSVVLIWIKKGQEICRKVKWIKFDKKKNSIKIYAIVPKSAEECLIGLRVNCETPGRGDTELLIDDIKKIKIKNISKISNIHRYLVTEIRDELEDFLPEPVLNNKIKSKTKIFNYIIIKIQSKVFKNTFVLGYPYMAYIDPSNICNYNCHLCPTGKSEGLRPTYIMKVEDFKVIIDQIGRYLYSLHLYNWGEPFLNKNLSKIIRYAKKFDIMVTVSTNLSILDEKTANKIIESGLDNLTISLDGVSRESYSKYRKGGDLDNVLKNLNMLLETKKDLNSHLPKINVQFIVNKYNEKEIPKVVELTKRLGTSLSIGKIRLDMGDEVTKNKNYRIQFRDWLPRNQEFSAYDENLNIPLSNYCTWPWERVTIHPDGNISPCCAIISQKYDFGNVLEEGFLKVWNGKKFRDARKIITSKKTSSDVNMPCNCCVKKGGFLDFQPNF